MSGQACSLAVHVQPVSSQQPGQSVQCTAGSLQSHLAPRRSAAALGVGVGAAVFCGGNRSDEENPARCGLAFAPEMGIVSPLAELSSQEVSTLAQVRPITMSWTLRRLSIAGSIPDIICRSYVRCTAHNCFPVSLSMWLLICCASPTQMSWLIVMLWLLQALGTARMGPC